MRILAQIAGRVEDDNFSKDWENAKNDQELKEALLHDERLLMVIVDKHSAASVFMGKALRDIEIPRGCLIAFIRREGETMIPNGNTKFLDGDHLTFIGDPKSLDELKVIISGGKPGKKSSGKK